MQDETKANVGVYIITTVSAPESNYVVHRVPASVMSPNILTLMQNFNYGCAREDRDDACDDITTHESDEGLTENIAVSRVIRFVYPVGSSAAQRAVGNQATLPGDTILGTFHFSTTHGFAPPAPRKRKSPPKNEGDSIEGSSAKSTKPKKNSVSQELLRLAEQIAKDTQLNADAKHVEVSYPPLNDIQRQRQPVLQLISNFIFKSLTDVPSKLKEREQYFFDCSY